MALAPHLWRMLGLGRLEVVVEFHPPTTLAICGSRKNLARYCEERVARGLADALSGRRERADNDAPFPERRLPAMA
jgi:1-acyl-sn-glycerol-3-phosphate acyltransferase